MTDRASQDIVVSGDEDFVVRRLHVQSDAFFGSRGPIFFKNPRKKTR